MALIICKECRRQFSDLAQACPGCGAPTSYSVDGTLPPVVPITPTPVQPVYSSVQPAPPVADTIPCTPETVQPLSAYQFVVSHTASNESVQPPSQRRQIGPLLVIGVFFLPWIFYWLLLRNGYGNLVRTLGFIWLLLCTAAGLVLNYGLAERAQQPTADIVEPTTELPREDLSNPVFYPLSNQNPVTPATNSSRPDTTTTLPANAGQPINSQPAPDESVNSPIASIYASSDDAEAVQQVLTRCLQQQADTGNYTLSDNGKSIAKMISACYSDFKPWFDQCLISTHNAKTCNLDAIDLARSTLQLSSH